MTGAHGRDAHARRLDIQGLRGLAVVPGVVYHMTDHLPGAVIFIDMFFAVSGYLITGRLIELAQSRSARLYYYEFYKFRMRRLFPAAFTVILATAAVAYVLFVPSRAHHIAGDAVAALLFYANIRYAVHGTDYMHRTDATTPLLPFWSLSMEEQFYLLWPVLVLLLIWWGAKREQQRPALVWASAVLLVASFGYGLWFTRAHHVAAYYDTPSRAWDFSVGMLLAVYGMRGQLSHGPPGPVSGPVLATLRRVRDVLNRRAALVSWTGGLLFLLAVFVTPTSHGFPVPWGAVGVLGAALVIYAGIDQRPSNWLLSNRFSSGLGDRSYAIYLVHFPVIIVAASYLSGHRPALYIFDVLAIAALSLVLYHFVEEPGRRGLRATLRWLKAGRHRPAVNAVALSAAAATVVFAVTPGTPALWTAAGAPPEAPAGQRATPTASPRPTPVVPPSALDGRGLVEPTAPLAAALSTSLEATAWPQLANGSRLDDAKGFLERCIASDPAHPPCVATPPTGTDPAKVALAWGDSTMLAAWPMLAKALVPRGWTVVMEAHVNCTAASLPPAQETVDGCARYHQAYPRMLEQWRPALVLMTTGERAFAAIPGDRERRYAAGLTTAVDLARSYGASVAIVSTAPVVSPERALASCKVAGSSPQDCAYTPGPDWFSLNRIEAAVAAASGATYADLVPLFCVSLVCPGTVGDLAVHADTNHITPEYAALLAPSFGRWLDGSGLGEPRR